MSMAGQDYQFAIVGAGPYGLAVASHLRAHGIQTQVFGKPMDFWASQMPKGMLLRSPWGGSHIADPAQALTLDRYEARLGAPLSRHLPLEDFVRYGQWFQNEALPDLDHRQVASVERANGGFRVTLDDGDAVSAENVVVATGIGMFANYPAPLDVLPRELVSHSSDRSNRDLGRFAGKRVAVVGAGQSAIESAALLHENGADVEVLIRQPELRWLRSRPMIEWLMDCRLNPFKAPGKIGPLGINWLIEHPGLFTMLPRSVQERWAYRAIRPAASGWLKPRTEQVKLTTSVQVDAAEPRHDGVYLRLTNGTTRDVDHVLLGTGYKIDIARYPFLSCATLEGVQRVNGYPVLDGGFETTLPGLYFVGAPAAYSFGPLCRFVAGTQYTAATLTGRLKNQAKIRSRVPVSV
jgi:FAD-dependent urate hydroxylase